MLGAAHALANPLTARYGIVHGEAVGLMLPHVIRFNGELRGEWYQELLVTTAGWGDARSERGAAGLAEWFTRCGQAGLATRLSQRGVAAEHLAELAAAPRSSGRALSTRGGRSAGTEGLYRRLCNAAQRL